MKVDNTGKLENRKEVSTLHERRHQELQTVAFKDFLEQTEIDWDSDVTEKEKWTIVFHDRELMILYCMYMMDVYYGAITDNEFRTGMKKYLQTVK